MKVMLGVIVSSHVEHCRGYLRAKNLNPKDYKCVNMIESLKGISKDTSVIITHFAGSRLVYEMIDFIKTRFSNVRYEDY